MKRFKKHMTYANVMSTIAVFFAIGGTTAFAASQLAKNSVGSKQLKKNAVTAQKIKKNAVTGVKIKKNAVTGAKIKNNSVTAAKVKNNSITGAKLRDASITGAKINLATLGPVPFASALTGMQRSGFVRVPAADGGNYDAARLAAPQHALIAEGPFTLYAKCFTDMSSNRTYSVFYISTTQNGAIFDSDEDRAAGEPFLDTATAEINRELMYDWTDANSATFYGMHSSEVVAFAPDGTTLRADVSVGAKNGTLAGGSGIWGEGNSCIFNAVSLRANP